MPTLWTKVQYRGINSHEIAATQLAKTENATEGHIIQTW